MLVNSVFSSRSINFAFMAKAKPETAPARPLFEWFAGEPGRRGAFRARTGYSDGRITNWRSRGVPLAELGRIAGEMGLTYEEYLAEAGVPTKRVDGPVPANEEAHAVRRLRKALPAYRAYVLSLALTESHEKQQLFLDIMREHVPDRRSEETYGLPSRRAVHEPEAAGYKLPRPSAAGPRGTGQRAKKPR